MVGRAAPSLKALGNPSLPFPASGVFGNLWCCWACKCVDPILCLHVVCVFTRLSSHKDTVVLDQGHPAPVGPHLNEFHLQGPCVQIRLHSEALGIQIFIVFGVGEGREV